MQKPLIHSLFDAIRANPKRGFPVLLGPTQVGKTFTVYDYAKQRGLPLAPVNLQVEAEEEIGGYPIRNARTNEVTYSAPPFLTTALKRAGVGLDQPFTLFLDEIDKARNDLLSCILSMTSTLERRLRHITFGPQVLICGAMNEPQRTLPEPLLARMLMIPYPYDQQEYINGFPEGVRRSIHKLYPQTPVRFPERPKAPGSMVTLAEWFGLPEFWTNDALKMLVVRGLFREQDVPAVMEEIGAERPVVDPVQWVKQCSPQALLKGLIGNLSKTYKAHGVQTEADMLIAFRARAEVDGQTGTGEIAVLYCVFADINHPKPAASVACNERIQAIGQAALEAEYPKRLKALGVKA